jgi:hypothetical protein
MNSFFDYEEMGNQEITPAQFLMKMTEKVGIAKALMSYLDERLLENGVYHCITNPLC